jgi:hypothetical protein
MFLISFHTHYAPPMNDSTSTINNCNPCEPREAAMHANITMPGGHETNLNVIALFVGAVVAPSISTGRHGDRVEVVRVILQ